MDDVQLVINNVPYEGWKGVSVRRSIDTFASSFDLTLTDTKAGAARTIKLGSSCQVKIGGELLITGYVDKIRPAYDARSRRLTVSGRSKVADLVDCSLPPREARGAQKRNQTLPQLAQAVCKLLGVEVRTTVSGLPARGITSIEIEETFFELLESQARIDAVMLVDDQDGNLVITRASQEKVGTALALGENIEAGEGSFDQRDRFSHYYVDGQQPMNDFTFGEDAAHVVGLAKDDLMRYRPTSIHGGNVNIAEAKRRAEWERNVRYGRSRQATYTVSGWRHKDGLWKPNTNVLVYDEWMGFIGKDGKGEWLMIGTVEFTMDAQGQRTRLTVMPAEAYDLIPLPPKEEDGEEVF